MNAKRTTAAVAGALVAGLALGSVVSSYAAAPKASSATTQTGIAATCGAAGLRLGTAMRDSGGRLLDVVAKLTELSTTDVVAKRQAGKSFSDIAAEKSVDSAAIVAEALKVRQTLLAEKVSAGAITQAQADTALANMKTRVTERVNSVNTNCDGTGAGMGAGKGGGPGRGNGRGAGGGMMGGGRGPGSGTATQ